MSPPTPDPDSPFAEFARPKESAVEQFLQRKLQDRKSSVARRQLLAFTLAGSVLAASAGIGIGVGPVALPAAIGFALGGALAGMAVGAGIGVVSWALMRNRLLRAGPVSPIGVDIVQGNRWDILSVWLLLWAGIGILCGAAFGAAQGALWTVKADLDEAAAWAMGGSTLGFAIAVGLWFARQRLRGNMKADETEF